MNSPRKSAGPDPDRALAGIGRSGFSLIELLVTLALLIVLVVMWHGFGSRSNQQRQKKACERNLLNIYMALSIYARDHDDRFPTIPGARTSDEVLSLLIPKYTVASEQFVCPGSKDGRIAPATPLLGQRISYAYFMGRRHGDAGAVLMSDRWIDSIPKTRGSSIFSTNGSAPGNNHHQYGGNFLLSDGEVRPSGPTAPFPIDWTADVLLLNPK